MVFHSTTKVRGFSHHIYHKVLDMKYIDAELLRKKIEYLKAVHIGHAAITKETNAVDGLDAALQVIDSLQQEQPEVDL